MATLSGNIKSTQRQGGRKGPAAAPVFADSPTLNRTRYRVAKVDSAAVLESWRRSLYAFEWLDKDGRIKDQAALPPDQAAAWRDVLAALDRGAPVTRPVLGIGINDCVEIGTGKAAFLALAAQGAETIDVYIPAAQEEEFTPFLASRL